MKCRRTINGKIIWIDNGNRDDTRPPIMEIQLTKNGETYKEATVLSKSDGAYVFACLPSHNNAGQAYVYAIGETAVPSGYTKEMSRYNIIYRLITVQITYVFNNIVHNDYSGKIYTEEVFTYPMIKAITIPKQTDVFPEYTGECEFVGWNTQPNGSGMYYEPDSVITLDENLILYAVWRSCMPTINDVYAGSNTVSGTGAYSIENLGGLIYVTFPNSSRVGVRVRNDNNWSLSVPVSARPLQSGGVIVVTQYEQGKLISNPVTTIVF